MNSLSRLVEVVRLLAESQELQPLLASIEKAAHSLLACERAQILQYDAGSEEFFQKEIRISARIGASARAAVTQRVIHVDHHSGAETLVVPLIAPEGELMGVLHIQGTSRFSQEEDDLALVLGSLAAIALKRQALLDAVTEKRRLERELELARELVEPPKALALPGFELAGAFHPARTVGGDCYDFVSLGPGSLAFLVADASGHGLDSALLVSRCRSYFRALASPLDSLQGIARRMNALLLNDTRQGGRFVAASLGRLSNASGCLEVIGAGQATCLLLASGTVSQVPTSGPPLGVFEDIELEPQTLELAPGDLAFFFTDGLSERRNPERELFGEERLGDALAKHGSLPLGELIDALHRESERFGQGRPQDDDVTCLAIRRQQSTLPPAAELLQEGV